MVTPTENVADPRQTHTSTIIVPPLANQGCRLCRKNEVSDLCSSLCLFSFSFLFHSFLFAAKMAEAPSSLPSLCRPQSVRSVPQSLRSNHDPLSFDALLDLAGPGPVPEPQQCRSCEKPITQAKLLDCLHAVCGACMTAAVAVGPSTDCPTCHLSSHTKARIPDYVAEHFITVSDRGRTGHVCAVHQDEDQGAVPEPATFYCVDCSVFMCSVCSAEHRQHSSFHSHVPVLLEDLAPEMVRVPVTCPSHGTDQLISGFCTTCRMGVCPTCTTGGHHTHTIVTSGLDTSVYAEVCRTLDEELARPVPPSKVDGVATTLRTLDELLAAGPANVKTQHAVLDEWARDGTAAMQARAEVLRGEVAAKWDVRRKALTAQRHNVGQRVLAFSQARNYATALCRIGAPREVLIASAFVKRRLSALLSWLHPIEPCVSRDPITVTPDASGEGDDVTTYGYVSEPSIRPWQQRRPPGTGGDHECIYVVGGMNSASQLLSMLERYDPSADAWVTVETMPTARCLLACAVLDNRLYAIGGKSGVVSPNIVEVFDPLLRTWDRTCAAMGVARHVHVCVTLGDHIYALGGGSSEAVDTVERYDAPTNRWELRASMYKCPGGRRACVVLGGHIYASGGGTHHKVKTVQRYEPTRDCWEPVQDMPIGRWGHAAAVLEGRLYVIGGHTSEEFFSSRVDRFDPARNEWESVARLSVGRESLVAVTAGERIYAIGGQENSRSPHSAYVEAHDAVSNSWTPCKPMPTAKWGFSAGVLTVEAP